MNPNVEVTIVLASKAECTYKASSDISKDATVAMVVAMLREEYHDVPDHRYVF